MVVPKFCWQYNVILQLFSRKSKSNMSIFPSDESVLSHTNKISKTKNKKNLIFLKKFACTTFSDMRLFHKKFFLACSLQKTKKNCLQFLGNKIWNDLIWILPFESTWTFSIRIFYFPPNWNPSLINFVVPQVVKM